MTVSHQYHSRGKQAARGGRRRRVQFMFYERVKALTFILDGQITAAEIGESYRVVREYPHRRDG